jgi:hypothetical protein
MRLSNDFSSYTLMSAFSCTEKKYDAKRQLFSCVKVANSVFHFMSTVPFNRNVTLKVVAFVLLFHHFDYNC